MDMIVLGIDHELQSQDRRLKTLISDLVVHEGITIIAEENRCFLKTVGRQVSESMDLPWIQVDMSTEDRIKAGIDEKLANRMQIRGYDENGHPIPAIRYAPVEDGIREEFWLGRIEEAAKGGKVLVVCGCLHCVPFSEKAERRGHRVALKLFHPENLSALKPELY